jgi:hypothetical protein
MNAVVDKLFVNQMVVVGGGDTCIHLINGIVRKILLQSV